jgi:hypothetical protein
VNAGIAVSPNLTDLLGRYTHTDSSVQSVFVMGDGWVRRTWCMTHPAAIVGPVTRLIAHVTGVVVSPRAAWLWPSSDQFEGLTRKAFQGQSIDTAKSHV